jgi:SAM-dependent methyltransferase
MEKSDWHRIQKLELQYHLQKDKDRILEINLKYWNAFLARVTRYIQIRDHTRILDVGCGCCGVLMALDKGTCTGIDPLMADYLAHFDHLHRAGANWMTGTIEALDFTEAFDVIFIINSLDHTDDPKRAADMVDRHLNPGGHVIISLNCHNTHFFVRYYTRFYRFIDPYHPHHFRPSDVIDYFPGYRILKTENIDDINIEQNRQYREKVLKRRGFNWKTALSYLLNPMKYPILVYRILGGRQVYRKKSDQKSIFSTFLFILQKPEAVLRTDDSI